MKILITDTMSKKAEEVFHAHSLEVVRKTGLSSAELAQEIPDYDALLLRSATKVTAEVLDAAKKLRVIGRAGIGIDNIDVERATERGIVVMNAPFGNSITTAEHALSLLLSLARKIPFADKTMHEGRWEKSAIRGSEVEGKTLGIIGCGNIGRIVAKKAQGLGMKVLVYDPFLTAETAEHLGISSVELDDLLMRSDFISCHVPKNEKTYHIIDADAISKMPKHVRIINCSRGGIVDEDALVKALNEERIAGAALDVFELEPLPKDSPLLTAKNLILTPHLGGSTVEADEKVVLEIAQQLSEYLLHGVIRNAINTYSLSAKENKELIPYRQLAGQMSSFIGQLIEEGIVKIVIEYFGKAVEMPTKLLTQYMLFNVLSPIISDVNVINAQVKAQERGICMDSRNIEESMQYQTLIKLSVHTDKTVYSIAGTLFDVLPRIVRIKEIPVEAELGRYNLYVVNKDQPGFIRQITAVLTDAGINIASFHLGRQAKGNEAVSIIVCDEPIQQEVFEKIQKIDMVNFCKFVELPSLQ